MYVAAPLGGVQLGVCAIQVEADERGLGFVGPALVMVKILDRDPPSSTFP